MLFKILKFPRPKSLGDLDLVFTLPLPRCSWL